MEKLKDIRAIAFDADDTLWALQNYFEDVEHEYCELLSAYGKEKEISAALFETESRNMADLGYGKEIVEILGFLGKKIQSAHFVWLEDGILLCFFL